jgi:hypothetical protein
LYLGSIARALSRYVKIHITSLKTEIKVSEKMVELPTGHEQAIDQATEAVKTRLKSRTPKGETRRFDWTDIWNETFDQPYPVVDRENARIRDGTLQRLLDNKIVTKDDPVKVSRDSIYT